MKPMFLILKILALMLCSAISFCQNKEIDSLKKALLNSKEDTNKVVALYFLGWAYADINDYKTAIQYENESLDLAQKIKFKKGEGDVLFSIGNFNEFQFRYIEAREYYYRALHIREEIKDPRFKNLYLAIAGSYHTEDNYPDAIRVYFEEIKKLENSKDRKGLADAFFMLAATYYDYGDFSGADKYYLMALNKHRELNDSEGVAIDLLNKSLLEYDQGHDSIAIADLIQSLAFFENKKDAARIAAAKQILGKLITYQAEKLNAQRGRSAAQKRYLQAENISLPPLAYFKKTDNSLGIVNSEIILGKIYSGLGNYSQAEYHLKECLDLAARMKDKFEIRDSYYELARLDSNRGNYQQAFLYYKLYILYRDSIVNENNSRKITRTKLQYEFDKKEDSLNQKQIITETKLSAQKKQKYFYWGGLALLAALSFFVFLNFRNQKKINRLAGDAHAKEKAELELQSLRAQLNPHFMFNSLNAIQELILLEENEKSQSYLARFSKLLRMLLENAERPFIPLQREIDFLQLYLSLENLRIPDLQHSITIDPAVDSEQTMIPNMILQPYIENAIWHGLSHKVSDKKLQLRIIKTNGIVQYEIEDNGVGRKKSAELKSLYRKEHKSKGMELLSKRFKLLAKEYGSDIETTITDIINNEQIAGTLVIIKVPAEISLRFKNQKS